MHTIVVRAASRGRPRSFGAPATRTAHVPEFRKPAREPSPLATPSVPAPPSKRLAEQKGRASGQKGGRSRLRIDRPDLPSIELVCKISPGYDSQLELQYKYIVWTITLD